MRDQPRLWKRGRVWWTWYYDRSGQRVRVSTGQRTKAGAELVARAHEVDAADPAAAAARKATLHDALLDLMNRRIEEAEAGRRSVATAEFYLGKAGHLLRVLEHGGDVNAPRKPLLLSQLTAGLVDGYISRRRSEGVGENSIHKELMTLRPALRLAKRSGKWKGDIEEILPVGFSPEYVPVTRWLRRPELHRLLAQLGPDQAARVAWIVATSGCWGESERAQTEDVGADLQQVHVRGTKRKTRNRQVPIVAVWQRELLEHALRHAMGPGDALFGPWTNVRRDLHDAAKRAGIAPLSPNDLRRTCATWLRAGGVRLDVIAAVLGHADTRMVERVYGRLEVAELAKQMAEDLGAGVSPQWGRSVPEGPEKAEGSEGIPPPKPLKTVPRAGIEPATRGFSDCDEPIPAPRRLRSTRGQIGAALCQKDRKELSRLRPRGPRRAAAKGA